jgi:predicted nucleic acid-binding protein
VLVVDTNVVAYLLVEGDKTAQARELWMKDPDWRAPRLLFYELANVFCQLVKRQALTLQDGLAGLESAVGLVQALDREPEIARVLEIAAQLNLSAYDAAYLAAAEALGTPLITEDTRLLGAASEIARSLTSVGS